MRCTWEMRTLQLHSYWTFTLAIWALWSLPSVTQCAPLHKSVSMKKRRLHYQMDFIYLLVSEWSECGFIMSVAAIDGMLEAHTSFRFRMSHLICLILTNLPSKITLNYTIKHNKYAIRRKPKCVRYSVYWINRADAANTVTKSNCFSRFKAFLSLDVQRMCAVMWWYILEHFSHTKSLSTHIVAFVSTFISLFWFFLMSSILDDQACNLDHISVFSYVRCLQCIIF